MKAKNPRHILAIALLSALPATLALGSNPIVTSIYTADPSAHVWNDGRLYVYPSRDIDPARGCDLMDKYHVFSTDDMITWRDEGQILEASQVKWGRKEGGFMWAPDCAYKNGTYYFYFPHPSDTAWNKSWKIGVATSKKPASDFVPLDEPIKGLEGHAMIDPCVFVDTDGQAYMYFGGGRKCAGGKLKDNMIELDGEMQPMVGLEDFHEATWVFKRNGIYYLTYSDNNPKRNQLRYATSDNPLGPWTSKGVYLTPTDCDTSHGSVVEYKGKWYAFYHNCAISGRGNLRSICVDEVKFNPDGTIQTVVQTKSGPSIVTRTSQTSLTSKNYSGKGTQLGGSATLGVDYDIRNMHGLGAYCEFPNVDGGKGGRAILEIIHAGIDRSKLRLTINGKDWSYLNTLPTGDWNAYTGRASITVPLSPGNTNQIRLTGGTGAVNIAALSVTYIDKN